MINNHEMVNVIAQQIATIFNLVKENTTTMYLIFSRKMGCIAIVFVAPNDGDKIEYFKGFLMFLMFE